MSSTPDTKRAEMERALKAAERMLSAKRAKDDLIEFTRLMMPSPHDPEDALKSRYTAALHHRKIAAALEEVEAGRIERLIITVPPRHGKSQLSSKAFPAWFMGRDPLRQVIVSSYSATMAEDFGKEVRAYMQTPAYAQVFPACTLKKGGEASDRLQTEAGGIAAFVGAGGALTGRGANLLLIDDPVKDRADADSETMRNNLWEWFTSVAMTRLMSDAQSSMGRVVIIMTRWHEDDLVGRLTDPSNKYYSAEEAAGWKLLHLPAIATEEDDVMGRKVGEALWPERISVNFLMSQKRLSSKNFQALYQGSPSPEDGEFFKNEYFVEYGPTELPKNLRMYAASDHAVSTKQTADLTCLMVAGVDDNDELWIMPDVVWGRLETDRVVKAMLELMAKYKPMFWWAEKGHISMSIGPFLRRQMHEKRIFCAIDEKTPTKDKMTRAQSIQGMMSMKRVHFPRWASWWEDAKNQMMKFPSVKHDDFVDTISWLGQGIASMVTPSPLVSRPSTQIALPGSMEWILMQTKIRHDNAKRASNGGW